MMDPVVPPKAENTTMSPDMGPCWTNGNLLSITELIVGYIGARNNPMSGKMKTATGASNHPVACEASVCNAKGNPTKTIVAAATRLMRMTQYHFTFFKTNFKEQERDARGNKEVLPCCRSARTRFVKLNSRSFIVVMILM